MQIDNLRAYLANVGMTFRDFSVIIDTTPEYLSKVANGRATPSRRLARDIYAATGGVIKLEVRPSNKNKKQEQQQQTGLV